MENFMEQTQAASSPAEVEDVFKGEHVSVDEFTRYRKDGELPERFKPAETVESAPTDPPEETVPPEEPESEPEEAQEQPQKVSGAEKRIKQLLAEKKELQRKLEEAANPTHTDPSPAQAQSQRQPNNYQEWRASFKPVDFVQQFAEKNPSATYEDAQAAMAELLSDAKDHFRESEKRMDAERQALNAKVGEARDKYENFDEIQTSFLNKVIGKNGAPLIPVETLKTLNDSEYVTDLLYVIGSDAAEAEKFVKLAQSNPHAANRHIARLENAIEDERAKPEKTASVAPEPKKTSAPRPPSPVTGGSSRAFDVSDESLSAEEWMRKRTQDIQKRGRL